MAKYVDVLLLLILCNTCVNLSVAVPLVIPAGQYDAEEAGGFEEGDMMLTEVQKDALVNPIRARNGLISENRRWPNNIVLFSIIGDFDTTHRNAIYSAIALLESRTCVKFREVTTDEPHYVAISSKPNGCYTAVGYQQKVQEMNLEVYPIGEGCFRPGTILHELMHALGFYHEQSSALRDEYIEVLYENIVPGKEFNFQKYSDSVVTDFDVDYDYDSCLHYRPGAFSVNGLDTIIPKDPQAQIGQRVGLSKKDIIKINTMYKCPIQV